MDLFIIARGYHTVAPLITTTKDGWLAFYTMCRAVSQDRSVAVKKIRVRLDGFDNHETLESVAYDGAYWDGDKKFSGQWSESRY